MTSVLFFKVTILPPAEQQSILPNACSSDELIPLPLLSSPKKRNSSSCCSSSSSSLQICPLTALRTPYADIKPDRRLAALKRNTQCQCGLTAGFDFLLLCEVVCLWDSSTAWWSRSNNATSGPCFLNKIYHIQLWETKWSPCFSQMMKCF